jgi:hypothetical protein
MPKHFIFHIGTISIFINNVNNIFNKILFASIFGISSSFGVPAKERTQFRGGLGAWGLG